MKKLCVWAVAALLMAACTPKLKRLQIPVYCRVNSDRSRWKED